MKNLFKLQNAKFFALGFAVLLAAIVFSSCASSGGTQTAQAATKSLDNLQTAFNGESNANAKYLAYAKKADEEGFTKAASLFRAAARAEEIHIANHAEVIRGIGANPKAEIKLPEMKTTAENLDDSVKGETYERDTMYPQFIEQARAEGNKEALRTFNFAKIAETEHAKLYTEARAEVDKLKGGKTEYYVCPICGYTTTDAKLDKCPATLKKLKFENVD